MKPLNKKDITQYVEANIGTFHEKRIKSLDNLKLDKVLKRKNPYLFKAKHTTTSEQIIRGIVDAHIYKGDYFKYCGQEFWAFISGNENLYIDIIEPLGNKAKERNDEFQKSYSKMINKFTKEFSNTYCDDNGEIDWEKLVRYNSGKR